MEYGNLVAEKWQSLREAVYGNDIDEETREP